MPFGGSLPARLGVRHLAGGRAGVVLFGARIEEQHASIYRRLFANGRTQASHVKAFGPYALVGGFELGDDVGGNAAALADLVAAGLCPLADLGAALAIRASTSAAAALLLAADGFAGMLNILRELFTELGGVARTEIDLIGSAIETKRDGLSGLAPIEIVDEKHLYLLCHGISPSSDNLFGD